MASDPEELRKQAWAADRAGNTGDAIILFQRIAKDYPDTTAALDARQYLASTPSPATGKVVGTAPSATGTVQLVRVVDLDIGFMNMVGLFIKAAFAIIPAAIIVALIWTLVSGIVLGLLSGVR